MIATVREPGASDESATRAAADVIQVSQLLQLATKADIADMKGEIAGVRGEIANLGTRMLKWMVGYGLLLAGVVIAGVGLVV